MEERGWGINNLEDARHCFVLYICKFFVVVKNRLLLVSVSPFPLQFEYRLLQNKMLCENNEMCKKQKSSTRFSAEAYAEDE